MKYLPALTTLRFAAAAMIVVHHTQSYFRVGLDLSRTAALDQGVSFFFVLSGFILFYKHGELSGSGAALRFVAARIARIWPLHAATLALLVLFIPQPWGPAGPHLFPLLSNLALLQAWVPLPSYFFSYNPVSWSLSTELFFYVSYPILSFSHRRLWPVTLGACALLAAGAIAVSNITSLGFYDGSEHISIDSIVYISPLARVFEFALGIATAQLWRITMPILRALPGWEVTVLEIFALSLAVVGMTKAPPYYNAAFTRGVLHASELKWLSESGSAPTFAVLIFVFAIGSGSVSRALSLRPLVLLGEISFALYLCHQLLFQALTSTLTLQVFGDLPSQMAVYWVMVLGLSYALHRLVELPCQPLLLGWLLRRGSR